MKLLSTLAAALGLYGLALAYLGNEAVEFWKLVIYCVALAAVFLWGLLPIIVDLLKRK